MTSIADRIREEMDRLSFSYAGLARETGIAQPTVYRIATGETKSPKQENVMRIASALRVSPEYLWTGRRSSREESNVVFAATHKEPYSYPLVTNVAAGMWRNEVVPYPPGAEDEWMNTDYKAKGKAFWLQVEGDSMTSPVGLSIPEGMLILVDTDAQADSGSLVVAQLSRSSEATFKKLVIDGGNRFLKPLNPSYPVITLDEDAYIVGVVVEAKMKIRFTSK
ncbi:putative HTH-type transcriptional regulator [Carnimonas sp. R-84981]|uniref:LexA family protein n=1 Tax=Carnimonas bestiolae TaxID=3402172 RepID=UPI003EDC23C1